MVGSQTFNTPQECWRSYQEYIYNYFSRVLEVGENQCLRTPVPAMRFNSSLLCGSCVLGGHYATSHVPMRSSADVAELFRQATGDSFNIGGPTLACVLGEEQLKVVQCTDEYFLRTDSYKFTLLYRSDGINSWETCSSALRFESDSRLGYNSWLLNHPIHHLQPGDSKYIRVPLPERMTFVGFVDWVMRSFAEELWAKLYPHLYLELKEDGGVFFDRFVFDPSQETKITQGIKALLRSVLEEGKASEMSWSKDLELWKTETNGLAEYAPEIYSVFRE